MISVVEVYNAIRDMANQDQKGFVTPQVFNSFAAAAQNNVFVKIADKMIAAKNARMRGIDLAESDSLLVKYKNFMSNYEKTIRLVSREGDQLDQPVFTSSGSDIDTQAIRKPADCYSVISVFDTEDKAGVKNFELVYNSRDMARILRSNLSAPTKEFPVALISNNIELFPEMDEVSDNVKLTYYRTPSSRTILAGALAANSVDTFSSPNISILSNQVQTAGVDLRNSRNFDLPLDMFPELMEEITSMIGINLRDPFMTKVAPKVVKK